MKAINLTTREGIKINFILLDSQVIGYYGYDQHQIEYCFLKDNITKTFCIKDLKANSHIQKVEYFFLEEKIQFIVAIRDDDGIETVLQVYNNVENFPLKLDRPIKGKVTNIFIKSLNDHFILTVGTLDSALYVTRFTKDMKKPLRCALARTDARNSLVQEVITLDTPVVIVGGSNGVLEFFLCKGPLDKEPELEFLKIAIPALPSNLPIVTLKSANTENGHLITVGQDYLKMPKRPNLTQKPSVSVFKFHEQICKKVASNIGDLGTTFSALMINSSPYQLWSCIPENGNIQKFESTIHVWSLNNDTWKFELDSTNFFKQNIDQPLKVHLTGPTSCWVLSKNQLFFIDQISERKGHKRKMSNESQSEEESESKTKLRSQ